MTEFLRSFDHYWRTARLYPALLAILPLTAAVGMSPISKFLFDAPIASLGVFSILLFALLYVAGTIARNTGKKVEARLLSSWGCFPTTQYLRHSDNTLPPKTRDRYRSFLEAGVGKLPSNSSESRNPAKADSAYTDAINWLKEQRRGPEFNLLLKENAEYGFRRNLRGLKPHAIVIILLSAALSIVLNQVAFAWPILELPWPVWGSAALNLVLAAFWLFVVNDSWVRAAAEQYAKTLLATCDAPNGRCGN